MKKVILSLGLLFISLSMFAQSECKCFTKTEKTYEIIGEITYEKGDDKYYTGIKDSIVYFTRVEYKEDKIAVLTFQTIPAKNVSLIFDEMSTSRTKMEDVEGYTELSIGLNFEIKDKKAYSETVNCHMPTPSSGSYGRAKLTIKGPFSDKDKITKLLNEIKLLQGS
jgi:hypothetical protein